MFYPPLKYVRGCLWLCLQARKGTIYFTELAERVEYGNQGFSNKDPQISNCQGLGRKNKHEILKTDRIVCGLGLY